MAPDAAPTRAAVRAARDVQETTAGALRATLDPGQEQLLEALLDAVEARYRAAWRHLVARLAGLLPGVGPAVRELADMTERDIDR